MDISNMNETELKALAFDITLQINNLQQNYQVVLQQLQSVVDGAEAIEAEVVESNKGK